MRGAAARVYDFPWSETLAFHSSHVSWVVVKIFLKIGISILEYVRRSQRDWIMGCTGLPVPNKSPSKNCNILYRQMCCRQL